MARRIVLASLFVLALTLLGAGVAPADDFYQGKTVRLLVGFPPGGGHDLYARLIARHLGKHIPGNPNIIVQNMPGGGGMILANYLGNVVRPNGLTLGTLMRVLLIRQLIGAPEVKFDATKMRWVGNLNQEVTVCYVRAATGVDSIEDVMKGKKSIAIGGTAPGSTGVDFPKLENALIGTDFNIIPGYNGTSGLNLAMERGEIDGRCGYAYASLKSVNGEWLKNKFVNVLVQEATAKHPDLPDVPLILDYAKSDADRQLLTAAFEVQKLGRPYAFPPGTKDENVKIMRKAFDELYKDPEFLADAKNLKLEINPLSGEEIDEVIETVFATPPEQKKRLAQILE
jgi:tripartite-type tricarboxylate transporter receptor subunit TctC